MPEAARAAAEIKSALGVEPRLIEGRGGVFQIRRGDRLVFDKADAGRFPAPGESARALS